MNHIHLFKTFNFNRNVYAAHESAPRTSEAPKKTGESLTPQEIQKLADHYAKTAEDFLKKFESHFGIKIDRNNPAEPLKPNQATKPLRQAVADVLGALGRLRTARGAKILSEHDIYAAYEQLKTAGSLSDRANENYDPLRFSLDRPSDALIGMRSASDVLAQRPVSPKRPETVKQSPAMVLAQAAKELHGLIPASTSPEDQDAYEKTYARLTRDIIQNARKLGATVDGIYQPGETGNVLVVKEGPVLMIITSNKPEIKNTSARDGWESIAVGIDKQVTAKQKAAVLAKAGRYVRQFQEGILA